MIFSFRDDTEEMMVQKKNIAHYKNEIFKRCENYHEWDKSYDVYIQNYYSVQAAKLKRSKSTNERLDKRQMYADGHQGQNHGYNERTVKSDQERDKMIGDNCHVIIVWSYEKGYHFITIGRHCEPYIAVSHIWSDSGLIDDIAGFHDVEVIKLFKKMINKRMYSRGLGEIITRKTKFWLDIISIDQSDDFAVRDATYIMSYVYWWASETIILSTNDNSIARWLSSVWTVQECVYSKCIVVFDIKKERVRVVLNQHAIEIERIRAISHVSDAIKEVNKRVGGWPQDKIYAIRHLIPGMALMPCVYNLSPRQIIINLIRNNPSVASGLKTMMDACDNNLCWTDTRTLLSEDDAVSDDLINSTNYLLYESQIIKHDVRDTSRLLDTVFTHNKDVTKYNCQFLKKMNMNLIRIENNVESGRNSDVLSYIKTIEKYLANTIYYLPNDTIKILSNKEIIVSQFVGTDVGGGLRIHPDQIFIEINVDLDSGDMIASHCCESINSCNCAMNSNTNNQQYTCSHKRRVHDVINMMCHQDMTSKRVVRQHLFGCDDKKILNKIATINTGNFIEGFTGGIDEMNRYSPTQRSIHCKKYKYFVNHKKRRINVVFSCNSCKSTNCLCTVYESFISSDRKTRRRYETNR